MPRTILVVEKDDLTRFTIVNMLESLQYHVVDAEDVSSALKMLAGVWFDVVIISLVSDDLDGMFIATEAKKLQSHTKVIVMSGYRVPESLHPLVDALVKKPFSVEQLDAAIKTARNGMVDWDAA